MPNRILVVDDEPDLEVLIAQRFRKRVRAKELTFQFASHGEEALAKLQSDNQIDGVLADINMPVRDGPTLLSRLREAHPLLRQEAMTFAEGAPASDDMTVLGVRYVCQ